MKISRRRCGRAGRKELWYSIRLSETTTALAKSRKFDPNFQRKPVTKTSVRETQARLCYALICERGGRMRGPAIMKLRRDIRRYLEDPRSLIVTRYYSHPTHPGVNQHGPAGGVIGISGVQKYIIGFAKFFCRGHICGLDGFGQFS